MKRSDHPDIMPGTCPEQARNSTPHANLLSIGVNYKF
jgi:hypothetical protein